MNRTSNSDFLKRSGLCVLNKQPTKKKREATHASLDANRIGATRSQREGGAVVVVRQGVDALERKTTAATAYEVRLLSFGLLVCFSLTDTKRPWPPMKGITSTLFEIANPAMIPSDTSVHKVTIASLSFSPKFEYYTVPKNAADAFLKAKVSPSLFFSFVIDQ